MHTHSLSLPHFLTHTQGALENGHDYDTVLRRLLYWEDPAKQLDLAELRRMFPFQPVLMRDQTNRNKQTKNVVPRMAKQWIYDCIMCYANLDLQITNLLIYIITWSLFSFSTGTWHQPLIDTNYSAPILVLVPTVGQNKKGGDRIDIMSLFCILP